MTVELKTELSNKKASILFAELPNAGYHISSWLTETTKYQRFRERILLQRKGSTKMKTVIATEKAPAAIGPYSQAILAGSTLYVSGQLPLDPVSGTMAESVEEQAKQAFANVAAILTEAGMTLENVVKTTIYMQDLSSFGAVNALYDDFFAGTHFPARACVEVAKLPKGALLEMDAVAVK